MDQCSQEAESSNLSQECSEPQASPYLVLLVYFLWLAWIAWLHSSIDQSDLAKMFVFYVACSIMSI